MPDVADPVEPPGQLAEIKRFGAPDGDLNGIAAAQRRRVRAHAPFEPFELSPHAARAVDLADQPGHLELAERPVPDVDHDQMCTLRASHACRRAS